MHLSSKGELVSGLNTAKEQAAELATRFGIGASLMSQNEES